MQVQKFVYTGVYPCRLVGKEQGLGKVVEKSKSRSDTAFPLL
jgi:hypothetical protein